MGRPKNSLNVTEAERERIRELYLEGVRVEDTVRRTGRCESVVSRTVRGMKRQKPTPRRGNTKGRNQLIVKRVVEDGLTQVEVARRFGLTPTRVCQIVREALGLRQRRPAKRKSGNRRASAPREKPQRPSTLWAELTRAQRTARERYIVRLVENGATMAAIARRYNISTSTVARILERVGARREKS